MRRQRSTMPLQKSKATKSIQSFLFHEADRIWIFIPRQHFFVRGRTIWIADAHRDENRFVVRMKS